VRHLMPYKGHRGMQRQQPLPCAGRWHLSCQVLQDKNVVRTDEPSEVCRKDDQRSDSDHGVMTALSHLPYRETIVPFPAEVPFASQIASFRSRIKVSTMSTVSRCNLASDSAAFPDRGRVAYSAGDMKSWWILQGIKMPPLL
jgi:hypothetical protein